VNTKDRKPPRGYYLIVEETADRFLFSPPEGQRRRLAMMFLIVGFLFLAAEIHVFQTHPPLDEMLEAAQTGADRLSTILTFLAFPLVGGGFLVAASFAWGWWSEIEFDASRREIIRRRHAFGQVKTVATLPFNRLEGIEVMKTGGLYALPAYHVLIFGHRRVWAKLPGYADRYQAEAIGRKLVRFMGHPVTTKPGGAG